MEASGVLQESMLPADPIADLINALEDEDSASELPSSVRRIAEVVVHSLHVNSERIAGLARDLHDKASVAQLG
eukprot:CAMPEP_0185542866 /NCGR_PEP_ID=MMETSP1381-20130426/2908_1 /TAXON_ID=298111 /ORGANISM="Pavlova sp., Strain CCMP459" /LENGTH=72 /DNA_ID=CAMNT_0028154913 /DNA_START=25 /DNA_END=239 /DNA_ORIENTATION=+